MADYQMGGYIEGETPEEYQRRQEEERRRREAEAANTPVTQTVVTNPDGSQQMTIKGTPQALSPANPNTPTVTQPVVPNPDEYAAETERLKRQAQISQGTPVGEVPTATRSLSVGPTVPAVPNIGQLPQPGPGVQTASVNPDAAFQRMLQVESGNQNYTPQGTPVTSPKGAMFAAQVMPTTAQNPGYGVRPAQAQTPEEYNRVGADYYQAMLKKYNGNEDMARAAYNAGPGRVDQAIAQGQKLGIDPVSLLPRETQDYIKKTAAPVVPGVQVASNEPTAGLQQAAAIRENNWKNAYETGQGPNSFNNRFTEASKTNDPRQFLDMHRDESLTPEQRTLAGKQAQQLLNQQMGEVRGKQELSGMSENDIARLLKSKTEEGSFAKLLLLGFISPTLAGKEAAKLGLNDQWHSAVDDQGKPVLFKTRDGVPIEGYNGQTGQSLSAKELIGAASQVGLKTTDISLTPHQAVINGEVHTISTKRTPNGIMYKDDTAGTGWTNQAPAGLTNIGQQDPGHVKGLTAKKQIETQMRTDNAKATAVGGQPLHSEAQIAAAGNRAYTGISGKAFPGAEAVTGAAPEAATTANTANPPAAASTAPGKSNAPAGPKSLAQQILDYDVAPPTGPTTAAKIALQNEINRLASEQGKTYNAGNFKIASKTRQDFTTGQQGKAVQSMNVAIDHLDTLGEAADKLKNGNITAFNAIANQYARNTGEPAITDFNALKSIVGSEVAKAVVGGASALGDREEIRKEIDAANSPKQLAGVIEKYQKLMAGQVKGLRQTYESVGLKDFDEKLLPRTKFVLNQTQAPSRSKW